jgi:hypothetical protein
MHLDDDEDGFTRADGGGGARATRKMVAAALGHPASETGRGRSPSTTAR